MRPSSYGNPKWKQNGSAKAAMKEGMGTLEAKIRSCSAMNGVFCESAVLADVAPEQAALLDRAGFGRLIPGNLPASLLGLSSETSKSSSFQDAAEGVIPDGEGSSVVREDCHVYQFTLEEAFFLTHVLDSLHVHLSSSDQNTERQFLNNEAMWQLFRKNREGFVEAYIAYAHLRNKRWVVRPGLQYGADITVYRHHPSFVHSDFAALVIRAIAPLRVASWTDMHTITRLCGAVRKTLLLVYVNQDRGNSSLDSLRCLDEYSVETVTVKRWLPEKNRDVTNLKSSRNSTKNEPSSKCSDSSSVGNHAMDVSSN